MRITLHKEIRNKKCWEKLVGSSYNFIVFCLVPKKGNIMKRYEDEEYLLFRDNYHQTSDLLMQIVIFMNTAKQMILRERFISHSKHFILNILYISADYVYIVFSTRLNFTMSV